MEGASYRSGELLAAAISDQSAKQPAPRGPRRYRQCRPLDSTQMLTAVITLWQERWACRSLAWYGETYLNSAETSSRVNVAPKEFWYSLLRNTSLPLIEVSQYVKVAVPVHQEPVSVLALCLICSVADTRYASNSPAGVLIFSTASTVLSEACSEMNASPVTVTVNEADDRQSACAHH